MNTNTINQKEIIFPDKKYKIIYADPPWDFKYMGKSNPNDMAVYRASEHYNVMSLEDIKNLPIKSIADKDCILFIWVIDSMLDKVFEFINSWGFKYKTVAFTWIKTNKNNGKPFYGLGYWTRCNPEQCLLATKGKISRISKSVEQLTFSNRLRHSQKPSIFREKIVQLMGDLPHIELFAREKVEGWDAWGDEL